MHDHTLEPAAQEIADATSEPPFLYELGPDGARKVLDDGRGHGVVLGRLPARPRPALRDHRLRPCQPASTTLRGTAATTAAVEQAVHVLGKALGTL